MYFIPCWQSRTSSMWRLTPTTKRLLGILKRSDVVVMVGIELMVHIFFYTRLREETIWDLPVLYAMDYDLRAIATLVLIMPPPHPHLCILLCVHLLLDYYYTDFITGR